MAPAEQRNFALRDDDGNEQSVFSGKQPRQAALKAARRLDVGASEDVAEREEIRMREKGTKRVHVYEGWAWMENAPEDSPEWMGDRITEANVSKQGVEHVDEI